MGINKKIKKIFIHVGVHKTATTTIQRSLNNNRKLLTEVGKGYLYPKTDLSHHHGVFLHTLASPTPEKSWVNIIRGRTQEDCKNFLHSTKKLFEKQVLETDCSTLIISGENLSTDQPEILQKVRDYLIALLPYADVKVIISVRDHISYSTSFFQQMIKFGINANYSQLEIMVKDKYKKTISMFNEVFGERNIIIYKFEDSIKHIHGPTGYFLNLLNFPDEFLIKMHIERRNIGISDTAVDMLQYVGKRLSYITKYKLTPGRSLGDWKVFMCVTGNKFRFSKDIVENLEKVVHDDKMWLYDNFRINYLNSSYITKTENISYLQNFEYDMKYLYYSFTPSMKKLVYDYLTDKLPNIKDKESIDTISRIINWYYKKDPDLKSKNLNFFIINFFELYNYNILKKIIINFDKTYYYYKKFGFLMSVRKAVSRLTGDKKIYLMEINTNESKHK